MLQCFRNILDVMLYALTQKKEEKGAKTFCLFGAFWFKFV